MPGIPGMRVDSECPLCGKIRSLPPNEARRRKFCSRECRDSAQRNRVVMICQMCGDQYEVAVNLLSKSKFCSKACANRAVGISAIGNRYAWRGDNVTRWAFHKRANKLKPPSPCERCGEPGELVHHKDENPANNAPDNLERLCRGCHARHHHLGVPRLEKNLERRIR